MFIFFILAVSLFACAQIGAAREEEAEERLETLLAYPVSRARLARWAPAAGERRGADASRCGRAAQPGPARPHRASASRCRGCSRPAANCLPVALLFLGIAALAYAIAPRASAGIAYGLVTVAFLWYLVGSLLGAFRSGSSKLTPFQHVGLVPAQSFRALDAVAMLAIAAVACLAALWVFGRRDLIGP